MKIFETREIFHKIRTVSVKIVQMITVDFHWNLRNLTQKLVFLLGFSFPIFWKIRILFNTSQNIFRNPLIQKFKAPGSNKDRHNSSLEKIFLTSISYECDKSQVTVVAACCSHCSISYYFQVRLQRRNLNFKLSHFVFKLIVVCRCMHSDSCWDIMHCFMLKQVNIWS